MGMFDDVVYEAKCQNESCDNTLTDWQSKDGDCVLARLTPEQLCQKAGNAYFYTSCDKCGLWNQWEIIPPQGMLIKPAYEDIRQHPYNKDKE